MFLCNLEMNKTCVSYTNMRPIIKYKLGVRLGNSFDLQLILTLKMLMRHLGT